MLNAGIIAGEQSILAPERNRADFGLIPASFELLKTDSRIRKNFTLYIFSQSNDRKRGFVYELRRFSSMAPC